MVPLHLERHAKVLQTLGVEEPSDLYLLAESDLTSSGVPLVAAKKLLKLQVPTSSVHDAKTLGELKSAKDKIVLLEDKIGKLEAELMVTRMMARPYIDPNSWVQEDILQEDNDEGQKVVELCARVGMKDYPKCVDLLQSILHCESYLDLLPLLRGALIEVIKREDDANFAREARRRTKAKGFSRVVGSSSGADSAVTKSDPLCQPEMRRWRRMLRVLFNDEAAVALLNQVIDVYNSDNFVRAAKELNESWVDGTTLDEQNRCVESTCLSCGFGDVLLRFGFSSDPKGNKEVNAILSELSSTSEVVSLKNAEVVKLIFRHVPKWGATSANVTIPWQFAPAR